MAIESPMSLVQLLSVGVALAICVAPILLLRPPAARTDAPVPAAVARNAWIAYALRVSLLVPLVALGAAGDMWPALVGAAGFGGGLYLLGRLRAPISALLSEAGLRGRPATLPAILAPAAAGNGTRLAAALVTVAGLMGLVGAEAAALVIMLGPLIGEGAGNVWFAALFATGCFCAVAAGENGGRYMAQALLGAILVGLFGSAAFLLYLHASDLRPQPPHGAFALLALPACCIAMLSYRQTKYVETPALVAKEEPSGWRRVLGTSVRWLQRWANVGISVLAAVIVVIAGMEVYALGASGLVRDGVAALGMSAQVPAASLIAIAVLALIYPMVDAVSWQSAAVLASATPQPSAGAALGRPVRMVAAETAILGIAVAAFGAIAAVATDLPPDATAIGEVIRQLVVFENAITDGVLALLLVAAFAMAASTMIVAVAAAMTIVRLDILPARDSASGTGVARDSAGIVVLATAGLVAAAWIASGVPATGAADARFFALALVFASLQSSLLPPVLARLCGVPLSAGSALAMMAGSVAPAFGSIGGWAATGDAFWLWLAVPAGLAVGLALLAAATLRGRATAPPA